MTSRSVDPLRRRQRRHWQILALLVLSLWAIATAALWQARRDTEAAESERLSGLDRAAAQIVAQSLQAVYRVMCNIRRDVADVPPTTLAPEVQRRLQALIEATPGLRTAAFLDASGRVLASNRPELMGREVAQNARAAADADPASLHVSAPFRYRSGPVSINLTLTMPARPGGEPHALAIMLDPEYFRVVMRAVLYAPDMLAWVVHGDGGLLMSEPPQPGTEALDLAQPDSAFERYRASRRESGVFIGAAPGQTRPHLVAYQTLAPQGVPLTRPLVLGLSREQDALLAPWHERTRTAIAVCLFAGVGGSGSLALYQRRRRHLVAQRRSDGERLELALRGADLGLWDVDMPNRRVVVNARAEAMLGLAPGEAPPHLDGWRERVHPEDLPRLRSAFQRVAAPATGHDAGCDIVYRMRHRDGRWLFVHDRGKVLDRAPDGRPLRMLGTRMDVSERKAAETALRRIQQALRERERELTAITDALPGPASRLDDQGRVRFANAAFARWFGGAPDGARGQTLREALGDTLGAALAPWLARALAGETVSGEQAVAAAGGQERLALVTFVPDRDPGTGLPVRHVVMTFHDITRLREGEHEREALERQLRESQKMEAIGTLAGGIAHDFNNILAAILGNTAMALEDTGRSDPALRDNLTQVQKAALRARSLVQQILAFSRREALTLVARPIAAVVDDTLALLRATLPASVELHAVAPTGANVQALADPTQLQQVLMNLATNAWHALPPAGGRIEIGFERLAAPALRDLPDGPAAHVWVSDNGSGMDEATRSRIFDPFFTTKPVGRGTGLGLSVVHGIVRAHRGVITVDSQPAQGSTFHVYLPAQDCTAVDEPAEAPPAARRPSGAGARVLYVDDDEVMTVMVQRLLQRAGYTVDVCAGADAALTLLRESQGVDIVVTDFSMPGRSGIDLAREVGALRADLPVILCSGLVSEVIADEARRAGVRALLKKENSVDELVDAVAAALAQRP